MKTENPRGFKDHTWKDLESILRVGIKSKTEGADILAYLQVNMWACLNDIYVYNWLSTNVGIGGANPLCSQKSMYNFWLP